MPTYDDHATGASLTTSGAEGTVMPDGETSYEHRLQCCTAGVLIDEGPLQCSEAAEDEHDTPATVGFLDWTTFDEATLPPRVNVRRSRLDRVLSPLKLVKADLPRNVGVEGLGNVIESAHGLFHSVRRLDFMESERTIYLCRDRGSPSPTSLPRRELEIYENELFDMSKYDCSCDYFTALGWTEESLSGCITLYRVLFGNMGEAVAIRPVASMRDVPSPVLVKMRTDARIKRKAVLTPTKEDDRIFEWRANPSRRPRYVGLDNGRGRRAASPLRSPSHSRAKQSGSSLADGDGICATIPQFFALLHAHRSILEYVQSSSIGLSNLEHDGAKPAVFLTHPPRSNPHEGAGVHVAILVPNDALWAEEEIVWTDPTGLAEFRQRQYRQLIERASARGRSRARNRRSRGYSRDRSRSQT